MIRDPRVVGAMRLIETRPDQRLTTAELARAVGLSQFHFVRLFGEQTGETVGGYTARIRLDAAALRLRWSAEPVMAIAVEAGYGSQAAFTRAFTARTGLAPARYRGQHGPPVRGLGGPAEGVAVRWTEALLCLGLRTIGVRDGAADPWGALLDRLPRALRDGPPTFVDILHDTPRVTDPAQVRRDACIVLPPAFDPAGEAFLDQGLHLIATAPAWYATAAPCEACAPEALHDLILDRWLPAQARYRLGPGPAALAVYAPPADPREPAGGRPARSVSACARPASEHAREPRAADCVSGARARPPPRSCARAIPVSAGLALPE